MKEGTSKIDTVAAAVTQFSKDVSPGVDQFGNPAGTLFGDLQTLLAESRARDMTISALQASVNTLFAAINERLPNGGTNGSTLSGIGGVALHFSFADWGSLLQRRKRWRICLISSVRSKSRS